MKWTLVLALSPKFPIHLLFVDSGQQSAGCLIINYAADKQKGAGPATCHPCVGGLWCRWNHAYFIINLHWNSRFLGASFGFNWLCARFKHRDCFEPAFGPVFTALTLLAPGLCVALMSPEIYCSLLSVCRAPAPWIPHCVDTRSFWHLHLSRDNHGELPKSILALPKYSLLPFPHFPASSIIISNNKLNVRHPFTLTLCLWLAFTYFDIDSTFRDTNSRLTAPHLSSPLYAISSVASFRQKKSNLWISIDVIKLKNFKIKEQSRKYYCFLYQSYSLWVNNILIFICKNILQVIQVCSLKLVRIYTLINLSIFTFDLIMVYISILYSTDSLEFLLKD